MAAVDVEDGTITIEYGKDANAAILGGFLSFRPLLNANEDIVWVCGNAADPSDAIENPAGNAGLNGTTLVDKYVPSSCRAGFGGN